MGHRVRDNLSVSEPLPPQTLSPGREPMRRRTDACLVEARYRQNPVFIPKAGKMLFRGSLGGRFQDPEALRR